MGHELAVFSASVVVVGDEVLHGFVTEGNAAALAPRLRGVGVDLRRIVVVPDDVDAIADEIRPLLSARPSLILTTGGVGGTWDDLTYEAVARAAGRGLEISPLLEKPLRRVLDWYRDIGFVLDEHAVAAMMRIATIPEQAQVFKLGPWLACPAGSRGRIRRRTRRHDRDAARPAPAPPGGSRRRRPAPDPGAPANPAGNPGDRPSLS